MTPCTRATAALLAAVLITGSAAADPIIWNGPSITFSKTGFADPMAAENQDRITDNVWITRADSEGLFNARVEMSYDRFSLPNLSPAGTEWATGATDDIGSLTFSPWPDLFGPGGPFGGPPFAVGNDFVVHLITEDIYLDLHLDAWGGFSDGGSFTYTRSTAPGTGGLTGDFNDDGTVDAADYTVWRDGLGGEFGPSDYDDWRGNYGATLAPVATGAVPEPAALGLCCLFLAASMAGRKH